METLETSQPNESQVQTFDESYVKTLRDEAASYRVKSKELETQLNEIRTKNAEEQGKYKELYEKTISEYEDLKQKHSEYEIIVNEIKTKDETERKKALNSLPKEYQSLYENATKEQIEVFAKHIKTEQTEGEQKPPINTFETKGLREFTKALMNNKGK